MPIAVEIRNQVEALTIDLIALGLCDAQNFPSLRRTGQNSYELSINTITNVSIILNNIPYGDIYDEIERSQAFNIKMLDGALIQMFYRFHGDDITAHRLAFFPSPYLEEFQSCPDLYIEDTMYVEVVRKDIVPFPLRFDFDNSDDAYVELDHPKSHLTLGQYKNCRIPVRAPLTPYHFISFILRNFYHTAYLKYSDSIKPHDLCFIETISTNEKKVLYVQVPVSE